MNEPESNESRSNRHELYRRIDRMDGMVREMHTALIGDKFGNKGFAGRLQTNEEEIATLKGQVAHHKKIFWSLTMAGTGVWALIVTFKEELVSAFRR